jgi:alkanesulfonate monooxygenase SsuD/methylene tetrahydromethanopterin reductase-like flavin-dependent oxidoreductase (luciferase family)
MKLGVSIGYWGMGVGPADQLQWPRRPRRWATTRSGPPGLWPDAATVLAWLAPATSKIKLGAGILQIPARSAAMTA